MTGRRLSGLVSVISVGVAGQSLGASTTFVRTAGMVEKVIAPEHMSRLDYFIKTVPKIDWQWMFVVGIFIGALIAAVTSGSFRWQTLDLERQGILDRLHDLLSH